MIVWLDVHFSASVARWLSSSFGIVAATLDEVSLRHKSDPEIFIAARVVSAAIMTKDDDFLELLNRLGPPPQIIMVTTGNYSNRKLKELCSTKFGDVSTSLRAGSPLVELSK